MSTPSTDCGRRITASITTQPRAWMARHGPSTASSSKPTCGTWRTGSSGERTKLPRSSGSTSPKLMGASGPSASRRWKTKSSSGRLSRCSTPSTRQSFSGSRTVPAQAAARTRRWMRSRWGLKSATSTGYSMPTFGAFTMRLTTNGWGSLSSTGWATSASSVTSVSGSRRACWRMGTGDRRRKGRPKGAAHVRSWPNLYLHYGFDLWAAQWRRRHARGDVIIVRYCDDFIVGFQHKDDAEQFLSDLRERFHRFYLELHPEKTRLIEFGRWASERRQRRGQGKPETFDFLGFTHMGGTTKRGKFTVRRCTIAKRLRKKLQEVKQTLRERMHWPIEKLGAWLKSVVIGHYRYYGVPRNMGRLWVFRECILRYWCHTLRRRSQRHRISWQRIYALATQWLPPPHILHPYPAQRLRVTTRGRSPVR